MVLEYFSCEFLHCFIFCSKLLSTIQTSSSSGSDSSDSEEDTSAKNNSVSTSSTNDDNMEVENSDGKKFEMLVNCVPRMSCVLCFYVCFQKSIPLEV